jgi:hypothetical protein
MVGGQYVLTADRGRIPGIVGQVFNLRGLAEFARNAPDCLSHFGGWGRETSDWKGLRPDIRIRYAGNDDSR